MPSQPTTLDGIHDPLGGKTWFDAKMYARPHGVDRDHGAILGCSIVTAGPALGHGVNLDDEFVARVAELGNAEKDGLKARFGHPNMCSTALGTFLGRWKSFSVVGNRVLANLHLSNSAKKTPQGDLYEYVMGMAEKEADMFGVSIVFSRGDYYKRDKDGQKVVCEYFPDEDVFGYRNADGKVVAYAEKDDGPLFVECSELHAADAVDEPAANEGGLFSRWTNETLAGQVTEFLDTHPEAMDIIADHPDEVAAFMARYEAHRRRKLGATPMADQAPAAAPAAPAEPTTEATPTAAAAEPAATEALDQTPEVKPAPAAAEPAQPETETLGAEPPADEPVVTIAELEYLATEYGADIAVQALVSGGGEVEAAKLAVEAARKELAALRASGGKPAGFVPQDEANRKHGMFKIKE